MAYLQVYIQDDSTPAYLYYVSESNYRGWVVSSEEGMKECTSTGWLSTKNDCACPQQCTAACAACGHGNFGAWEENTGKANRAGACDSDDWCPSGTWIV